MRNLIYAINVTIDGCCDHTKIAADDETHEFFTNLLQKVDTLVYGRKTYQLMVPFWPDMAKDHSGQTKAINEFAQAFNSISNIIVVSKTLREAEEKNTKIVRSALKDEILKLKQEQGRPILTGGVSLPAELITLGLVDEFHIVVHPVIVGEGRRAFEGVGLQEKLPVRLVESKTFKSGSIALRYLKQ